MNNIEAYRSRTLKAVINKINYLKANQGVEEWDYKLDDLAREILDLPYRPLNADPYVGWLGEIKVEETILTKTSGKGINLIKRWEGFRANAYLCPANVWTIGYGHTKQVYRNQCITKAEGENLLRQDLRYFEEKVNQLVKVKLTQSQYDALVSFTYNVGVGAFGKSTLLKKLNQGKYSEAANEFSRWVHGGGKKLPGLVSRRKEEKKLFLS